MKIEPYMATGCKVWDRIGDGLLAAGLFVASLFVYLQTLAPSVATLFDDSLEFPLVAYQLGIAHPTGYPLYTLLGKLLTLGPWPNVAWAVNLLSALAAALTVALVYLASRQLTWRRDRATGRRLPALLGALALAASPVFWSQSVIAEVYTLNSAFFVALFWLVLRWARRPLLPVTPFSLLLVAPKERPARFLPGEGAWARVPPAVRQVVYRIYSGYRRFFPAVSPARRLQPHWILLVLAALFSLSLTHHRLMILLAPALFVYMILVERRVFSRAALLGPEHPDLPRWRQYLGRPVILLAVCLGVPLLLYLYLPLRGQVGSLDGLYANTWSGFWGWVTASSFSVFLGENPLARNLDASYYIGLFLQQFGPVGLALALVGLAGLVRQPKALVLTGLAFLTYVAFAVAYRVPDVEVFFIPAFVLVAVWIGAGLDYAADLLHIRGRSMWQRRLLAVTCALLFVLAIAQPLAIAARNYSDVDLSRRWIVHDYGQYVLEQPLPTDSTIVGLLGETTLLRYFQRTTGQRTDIEPVAADDEAVRREAVDAALAEGRATYITRPLPGLAEEQSLGSVTGLIDVAGELETLIRVGDPVYEIPPMPRPLPSLEPIPGLQLLGYGVWEHGGHWQTWTRLRLWWRAAEGLDEPLKISARLVDTEGQVVAVADAEPVSGAYPTTSWRTGEVVADAYEIPLPSGFPPGDYSLLIILYDPATATEQGRAELPPIHLEGNPTRPPRRALEEAVGETPYALFGDVELLGYTPPSPDLAHPPDGLLPLALLWQARGQPQGDLRGSFWLEGVVNAHPLAEEPVGGSFPTSHWSDGQVVGQQLDLRVPEGTEPGTYHLKLRVTRDGQPVPWGRGLIPSGSDLNLGTVQIGQ